MAKKSATQRAAEAGAKAAVAALEGDPELDLTDVESPNDADVLRALAELDEENDVEWSVSKMDGTPQERGFIEKITSSQLDRQRFRDLYGPGRYRIAGRRNGQFFQGSTRTIQISSVGYKPPQPAAPAPTNQPLTQEQVLALIAQSKAGGINVDKVLAYATALSPLLAPVIARVFAPAPSLADQLSALKALKDLEPEDKHAPMLEQLKQLTSTMARLREMTGDNGGSGTTWLDVGMKLLDGLKPILAPAAGALLNAVGAQRPSLPSIPSASTTAAIGASPAASVTHPPTVSASGGAPQPTSHSPSPANGNNTMGPLQMLDWFRNVLTVQLLPKARVDSNPGLYAEVVLDNLPEGVTVAQLLPLLERSNWWPELQTIAPEVARYPHWFRDFRNAMVEMIKNPPTEPTDEPTPAPGNGAPQPAGGTDQQEDPSE